MLDFTAGGYQWRASLATVAAEDRAFTDREVRRLAALSPDEAVAYFQRQKGALGSLLWIATRAPAEARGKTPEQWATLFDHTNLPAATLALLWAVAELKPLSRLARGLATSKGT
ncbi:MAG TPA: hypothetical protein VGE74_32875 [Gemmata sp.]